MEHTVQSQQPIAVAFISDDGYVMPTCVAIQSLVESKAPDSLYHIHIVCASLSEESQQIFRRFESETVQIHIILQSAERFAELHVFQEGSFCVATPAALLKCVLPELLPDYDKVLYLDGDLLVREDLTELYRTELGDAYLAAVTDSGTLYSRGKFVRQVQHYFNSGVMLLNLAQMRRDGLPEKLIQTKAQMQDSSLMDQNVLNIVCDGRTVSLPVRYNFLPINLLRAAEHWNLEQLNALYGTDYPDEASLFADAAIIHFSSKDKPWKEDSVAYADDWYRCYYAAPIDHPLKRSHQAETSDGPWLSVILSGEAPQEQTLKEIEILGGPDALNRAKGQYLWFGRNFTLEEAEILALAWETALANDLDAVLLDTADFRKKRVYPTVSSGQALYARLIRNADFHGCPSGALYRREYLLGQQLFPGENGEIFAFRALVQADRVKALNRTLGSGEQKDNHCNNNGETAGFLLEYLSKTPLDGDTVHAAAIHIRCLLEGSGAPEAQLMPILALFGPDNYPSEVQALAQYRSECRQLREDKAARWEELQALYKEKGQRWQELQALYKEKGERWQELQALKKEKAERWQELQALKKENADLRKELQAPPKKGIFPDGTLVLRIPSKLARLLSRIAAKLRKGA